MVLVDDASEVYPSPPPLVSPRSALAPIWRSSTGKADAANSSSNPADLIGPQRLDAPRPPDAARGEAAICGVRGRACPKQLWTLLSEIMAGWDEDYACALVDSLSEQSHALLSDMYFRFPSPRDR